MTLGTYDDLTSAVAAFTHRSDIAGQIPVFIRLAEAQMDRRLVKEGVSGAVKRAVSLVDEEYSLAPPDLAFPIALTRDGAPLRNVTDFQPLIDADPHHIEPSAFMLVGQEFRYWPAPTRQMEVALTYGARLPGLSPDQSTNWLLDRHPDAYLYGALMQTAPYLDDDTRVGVWGTLFTAAMDDAVASERARRGSQTSTAFRADLPRSSRYG